MINNKKLCVEISENLGNQMFMYAHAYALSKKLNRRVLFELIEISNDDQQTSNK